MLWLINTIFVLYLIVSNLAIMVRLYKSVLQYMTPLKGYATSFAVLALLLTLDVVVFSLGNEKLTQFFA